MKLRIEKCLVRGVQTTNTYIDNSRVGPILTDAYHPMATTLSGAEQEHIAKCVNEHDALVQERDQLLKEREVNELLHQATAKEVDKLRQQNLGLLAYFVKYYHVTTPGFWHSAARRREHDQLRGLLAPTCSKYNITADMFDAAAKLDD